MSYLFTGQLRARSCGGSTIPVGDATLKLYRSTGEEEPTFGVRKADDVKSREYALIAQGRTDERGEFRIDIREKSVYGYRGSKHVYAGEPFVLEVVSRGADGRPRGDEIDPVQFSLGLVRPDWSGGDDAQSSRWEHEISADQWAQVRAALDTWSIVGRVKGPEGALGGLRVFAYDADLVQDDFLGEASTDSDGRFRIDYPGSAFRRTVVPGADFERGGPEVYFRVEDGSGAVVYQEGKSRGNQPDRANAANCLEVELEIG